MDTFTITPPSGFVIDEPQQLPSPPSGFQLDSPSPVLKQNQTGATLQEWHPTLWQRLEMAAPSLFSTQIQPANNRPYGFVPNLFTPSKDSLVSRVWPQEQIDPNDPALIRGMTSAQNALGRLLDNTATPGGFMSIPALATPIGQYILGVLGVKTIAESAGTIAGDPTAENIGQGMVDIPSGAAMTTPAALRTVNAFKAPVIHPVRPLLNDVPIDIEASLVNRNQLPPATRFINVPGRGLVDLTQLSPQEQSAFSQALNQQVIRDNAAMARKRPAQEAPVVVGEQPQQQTLDIAGAIKELTAALKQQQIIPGKAFNPTQRDVQGGQISFSSRAEANALPNALQQKQAPPTEEPPLGSTVPVQPISPRGGDNNSEIIGSRTQPSQTMTPTAVPNVDVVPANRGLQEGATPSTTGDNWQVVVQKPQQLGQQTYNQAIQLLSKNETQQESQTPSASQSTEPNKPIVANVGESGQQPTTVPTVSKTPSRLGTSFFEKEKELRGPFVLNGPLLVDDAKDLGVGVGKDGRFSGENLYNRLSNKLKPAEKQMYDEAGLQEFLKERRTPEEVVQWMQDNGPRVEVKSYGAEGKVSEAAKELGRMQHEWYDRLDNTDAQWANQYAHGRLTRQQYVKLLTDNEIMPDTKPETLANYLAKADKYKELTQLTEKETSSDTTPRMTGQQVGAYKYVSPKSTDEPMPEWTTSKSAKNVQRVDVMIPLADRNQRAANTIAGKTSTDVTGELWQPDSLHEQHPNTIGWAMLQYVDGPKGERIALIGEHQDFHIRAETDGTYTLRDEGYSKHYKTWNEANKVLTDKYPLLKDRKRLILKAAIDQARKEGATHIAINDAETAMMSQGHVAHAEQYSGERYDTEEEAIRDAKEKGITKYKIYGNNADGYQWEASRISQEPGMRLNYDKILPTITSELTGSKGEKVSLGELKNAMSGLNDQEGRAIVTARMYALDKLQDPKSKQALKATTLYANPVIPIAKDVATTIGRAINIYSEPLVERLRRMGGTVSKTVANEAGQIVSHTKQFYGSLTTTLDPAKKAVGALNPATTWMRQLQPVTPNAAFNNLFGQNEGAIKVPSSATTAVGLLNKANVAIGQLATKANPDFVPSGKLQRLLTPYGLDIIRRGGGKAWSAWAEGIAKLNGKNVQDVEAFFRRWKDELDKPGTDVTTLNKINQDFERQYPRTITHIKPGYAWHEVVTADPYNYLEAAAQRTSHAVAFREVYKPGSGLLENTRKAVQRELPTDVAEKEFDSLMRALQGLPVDSYSGSLTAPDSVVGGATRMLTDVASRPLKALMLTGNALTNLAETIIGGPAMFLGYEHTLPALFKAAKGVRDQLELMGLRNQVMRNWSFDPTSPIRSGARITSNAIQAGTFQQLLNEVQETTAAASAKAVADAIKNDTLSNYQKGRMREVFKSMGFTDAQAGVMLTGNGELLNQFQTKAASWLTGGNVAMAERSKLGANRLFNELFWFHTYPQTMLNQLRATSVNVANNIREYWKNPNIDNGAKVWHSAALWGRQFGGKTLQGALTIAIVALAFEGLHGLKERKQEAKDDPWGFLTDSYIAAMGGPLYLVKKMSESNGDSKALQQTLATTMTPVGVGGELLDASLGNGRYEGRNIVQRIGMLVESKTPGLKVLKTGLAISGLSQDDPELRTALNAFYRWRKDNLGQSTETHNGPEWDETAQFRAKMKDVVRAMEQGKDWRSVLQGTDFDKKKVFDSLIRQTVLKNSKGGELTEEQLSALRKHIGSGLVDRLQQRDAMVKQIAYEFMGKLQPMQKMQGLERLEQ